MLIVTKIGSGVNYHERTPSVNSHDSLITWSFDITWWIIIIISPLPQCLWPQNLVEVVTYLQRLLSIKSHGYIFKCSCEITWQTKIIIYPLSQCLCLPNLAGWGYTMTSSFHKLTKATTWQDGCMQFFSKRPFSPKDHYITSTTKFMAIKLGKVVSYYKVLPCIKSHNPLKSCYVEITWQIKNVLFQLP